MKTPRLPPICLLAIAAALAGGCATTKSDRERLPGQAIVTSDYENVYMTGSYIPVKVPKSPTARILPTASPLSILTPDDVRRQAVSGRRPLN